MAETLNEWEKNLSDAQDALDRVKAVLLKRQERVGFCHRHKVAWNKRARAAEEEHRYDNAERAQRKAAYWNELEDKAIMGRAVANQQRKRIEKKIKWYKAHKPEAPAPDVNGVSVPDAPWNPNKLHIANSIIPWLYKAWAAGWRGYVTSGYRSAEYQCQVCIHVCNNCGGCSGTCAAPGTSNHGRYGPGQGAVDVTDYYTFAAVMHRIGAPLFNDLARDPVHFSFTGH